MKVSKAQVVSALREIAVLLEYRGESVFRARAYENAARALAAETGDLPDLIVEGRLEKISGIGKATAQLIRETAAEGTSKYLEELREGTPSGLFELMQVPGLGSKKITLMHEQLGVNTIADLEVQLNLGTVAKLAGFGAKTAEKIATGLRQARRYSGRSLYHHALLAATPILNALRNCGAVETADIAGSLRRCMETVADIDFVAGSARPEQVMDAFIRSPGVVETLARGSTKTTVLLDRGLQADLRVVPPQEFATALHHFTGSREHNIQLRARAVGQGIRISEYGLFREETVPSDEENASPAKPAQRRAKRIATAKEGGAAKAVDAAHAALRDGTRIEVRDEQEFFRALGLSFIPPELREGDGEIEAAARNALPNLVALDDYRGVIHVHSTWSDGVASIRDLALEARDKWGWEYLAICDHSEIASYAGGVKRDQIPKQHAEIDELNHELARAARKGEFQGAFRILKSCECDILADGRLDYPDDLLASMDLVVASVHSRFQMPAAEMTDRILRALDNPYVTILGHATGRLLLSREPYDYDMDAVLHRAAETGTIIEINGDPRRLDLDWRYARRAKHLGVRFAVNPDAHSAASFANVQFGINMSRKAWLEPVDILNCLPLDKLLNRVQSLRESKLSRR